jgi:GH24 family phage-related lysozyme (muramidase)
MRPTARAMFRQYSEGLEGRTRHLYSDVAGLLTVSVGCLVDPFRLAANLPWVIGDRPATKREIHDDWHALKSRGSEVCKWVAHKQAPLTRIRLTDEGVDALLDSRIAANEAHLKTKLFRDWDSFTADHQLAIMSLCWAIGAGLNQTRPAFVAAVNRGDWLAAKSHAHIRETNNAGVVPRNRAQELLFDNGLTVIERKLDPSWLWWPNRCAADETLREASIKALGMIK